MNQIAPIRLPQRPKADRRDQEFLPAALEILETPPSPVHIALISAICGLAIAALAWSYFGQIDIFAVAQGKIKPIGDIKTIQPLATGRVVQILVRDGMHVRSGDLLIALDRAEANADVNGATEAYAAFQAEAVRRQAAISAARLPANASIQELAWPTDIPAAVREREARVLANDLRQLQATLANFHAQKLQKQAERERLGATVVAEQNLIDTLSERVVMRRALEASKAGSKASLLDATETLQYQETAIATQKGQFAEAEAGLEVIETAVAKARDTFVSENSQKLADALRQADDYRQRLAKAEARASQMDLTSPIDGTVQGLAVTTIGQVATTGQELMRVVPDGLPLEIEVYVENRDIGFVHVGQEAIIKVESFPFTRYGTLTGKVTRVARDSIPAPDVEKLEADPTKATKRQATFVPAKQTQSLVYAATVQPDTTTMMADGREVALSPGMSASVEIQTGRRRLLEYIFSPLVEVSSQAMHER